MKQAAFVASAVTAFVVAVFIPFYYLANDSKDHREGEGLSLNQITLSLKDRIAELETAAKAKELSSEVLIRHAPALDPQLADMIFKEATESCSDLNLNVLLVLALIETESSFNPMAKSSAGAVGLMQVMPKHHPDKVADIGGPGNLFQIRNNIRTGCAILSDYYKQCSYDLRCTLNKYIGMSTPKKHLAEYKLRILSSFASMVMMHEKISQDKIEHRGGTD